MFFLQKKCAKNGFLRFLYLQTGVYRCTGTFYYRMQVVSGRPWNKSDINIFNFSGPCAGSCHGLSVSLNRDKIRYMCRPEKLHAACEILSRGKNRPETPFRIRKKGGFIPPPHFLATNIRHFSAKSKLC